MFFYRMLFLFFNDTATTEIYTYIHTLSLHDALPLSPWGLAPRLTGRFAAGASREWWRVGSVTFVSLWLDLCASAARSTLRARGARSEEHTSELQSLMRISYAVFCLKKKKH